MSQFPRRLRKLQDCQTHGIGSGAELLIVEGDSASRSVCRVRDEAFQAVLPMQGKPLNTLKARPKAIENNTWFVALIDAIGCGWGESLDLSKRRYDRIVLLFDPDADGIHCGVLMLMFFYRWMRALLESEIVHVVRAPLYRLHSAHLNGSLYAYTDDHLQLLMQELETRGVNDVKRQHFRGLGNLEPATLVQTCVAPDTRRMDSLGVADAEAAIAVFVSNFR